MAQDLINFQERYRHIENSFILSINLRFFEAFTEGKKAVQVKYRPVNEFSHTADHYSPKRTSV